MQLKRGNSELEVKEMKRGIVVGMAALLLVGGSSVTAQQRMKRLVRLRRLEAAAEARQRLAGPGFTVPFAPMVPPDRLLLGSGGQEAAPKPGPAPKGVDGQTNEAATQWLVTQIPWHKSLDEAEVAAKQQGKLVFWMHMLGQIDGAT
jgi:hypothetical protein